MIIYNWTHREPKCCLPWLPRLGDSAIRASIEKGCPLKALSDYKCLLSSGNLGFRIGSRTLWLVLKACGASGEFSFARETHSRLTKIGFLSCDFLLTSLFRIYLDYDSFEHARLLFEEIPQRFFNPLYGNLMLARCSRCGLTDDASQMFEKMPTRDLISWNTMAAVWARSSQPRQAMTLFEKMLLFSGIEPDGFTFSVTLSACAQTGALAFGRRLHHMIQTLPGNMNPVLASALIDMYAKCGKIDIAWSIFDSVEESSTSVWNSMVSGLAVHGRGRDALQLFNRMLETRGVAPDHVTFLGLLTACSHSSLGEEGLRHFFAMKLVHSIEPRIEHYGCLIDLLSRAGRINEARLSMEVLPVPPDAAMWRALLSGCRKHGRTDITMSALLPQLSKGGCSSDFLLLSGLHLAAGQWSSAETVWRRMKEYGLRKKAGLSWVEFGGRVEQFKAGERWRQSSSIVDVEGMQRVLEALTKAAREMGFEAIGEVVGFDLLEEEKEANLMYHSEKLAVAYAVVKTAPGTEIRVTKNLRACVDCHHWLKAASKFLGRVIVVRDRIRFHHFVMGSCTCKDFW